MEDILAGNIVLVSLCAYGAYLLFFDGGVTQAALENQAVQQLALEEGDIMATAPRAAFAAFDAAAAAADPSAAARALADEGCARVNGALSAGTAGALLAHVNADLEAKRRAAADDLAAESASFGDVLMRTNRYDLKLELAPPVVAALGEALPSVAPLLADALGEDAELFELAALISDPKAPRQPAHPDTPHKEGVGASIVTAFVALQDVDAEMGPTSMIPRTHTADAHAKFNSPDDGGRARVALLREAPNHVGELRVGDANLIDSRLIHCGGSNDSRKRRVLFYFSFRRKGARTAAELAQCQDERGAALRRAEEVAAEAGRLRELLAQLKQHDDQLCAEI